MSILKTILKPVKAVDNEFEALVHKVYQKYNEKTGNDQYALSNFYIDGAYVFHNASAFYTQGFSEKLLLNAGIYGLMTYMIHKRNKKARSIDETIADSPESVKHPQREIIRASMKFFGRGCLFVSMGYLLTAPEIDLDIAHFCQYSEASLYALCGYTSAMDLNNPKKSKVLSKVKDLLAGNKKAYGN